MTLTKAVHGSGMHAAPSRRRAMDRSGVAIFAIDPAYSRGAQVAAQLGKDLLGCREKARTLPDSAFSTTFRRVMGVSPAH